MNSLDKMFREIENLKNIIANEKCDEVRDRFKRLLQDTLDEAKGLAENVSGTVKKTFSGFRTEENISMNTAKNQKFKIAESAANTQAGNLAAKTNRQFTTEELAQYNGKNGKAAYIAVEGIVYDISPNIEFWTTGINSSVIPGRDITAHIARVYGSLSVLRGLLIVGILKD